MRSEVKQDPPAARPKRLPRAVREQQMLDAAVRVFSRSGYHAASMDEIAEQCEVSKPLLYLYLGSKEELFGACLRREADRLIEALADAVDPELEPGEQLFRGLVAFFAFVAEHRESWIVLYQQARSQGGPIVAEVVEVRRMVTAAVAGLVRASAPVAGAEGEAGPVLPEQRAAEQRGAEGRGEAVAIAHALVGGADALADWVLASSGAEPPETTARRLMNVFWIGLERRMAGERYTDSSG
ncbi:TetR/AcrR family transcriptional regulator [Phaeacidiphilus oryzae]|uniref:TetR/AcrR family transcriptional regulator n=1 Tax=Phaeacidiphilus oryzae TaxID=348818 RepID=UPI00056137A2|nr:TetR/AcrR family transcriptional regulator [Phaeacidiphilus oryzae]